MQFVELKLLIFAQMGIDIAIVIVFIFFLRRLRTVNCNPLLNKGLDTFEAMLVDADKLAVQLNEQLKEKSNLIKRVNEQLDKKILSTNMLLKHADALLSNHKRLEETNDTEAQLHSQEKEIFKLAKEGHDIENIANALSVPKEEVKLVLNLKKKILQIKHDKLEKSKKSPLSTQRSQR